jgi:hypothetical protein
VLIQDTAGATLCAHKRYDGCFQGWRRSVEEHPDGSEIGQREGRTLKAWGAVDEVSGMFVDGMWA